MIAAYDATFRHVFDRFGEPPGGRERYTVYVEPDKPLTFERWIDGVAMGTGASTAPSAQVWHHVAAVYDSKQIALYVDAALMGTAGDVRASGPADVPLCIGSDFRGAIDEVAIYDKALTTSQLAEHVAAARR